ncbi:MAG: CDP-alcohol phosphatidyltransferase family protein [Flavobacteriales bacterium]|nr:CDP-alcohol phosphatidyltransferase family protein [Flavobacteriales bacterium]
MNIVRHIPNTITCLNLLCGCLAVVAIFDGDPLSAAILVVVAAIFDFFDGFAARLLKVSSPIGKELDSLADGVTFGVVPGLMLLHYLQAAMGMGTLSLEAFVQQPLLIPPLAVPIFSALRLAKFNVDERQALGFHGLPTPASALWCISIPLIQFYTPPYLPDMSNVVGSPAFLIASSIGLSALMVSDIPLMAMKFKDFGWKGNGLRYGFLISALLLLIILQTVALPVILLLYVIFSIIHNQAKTA